MTTAAATNLTAPAGIAMLPLSRIAASKSNPRKTFTGIEDLAADFKLRGVLQPVLVRPAGADFELVFGERRWRAAKVAKLDAIPAMVRQLNDEQVLEIQLVENAKREDVHPLEEAEGYNELHVKYGYSAEEIAAKVGRSKRVVYERMQLCKLVEGVKKLAFEGKLPASHLVLVARVPEALQLKAAEEIVGDQSEGPMSYRDASDYVQREFMLRLDNVPWDLADATLVAPAGACTKCPKRTGNQPELFADIAKKDDLCTDSICFRKKENAVWQIKVKKAEAAGQKILDGAEAKKLFPYGGDQLGYSAPFKKLNDKVWLGDKNKTVKALLGKDAPAPVLARTPDGAIVELVPSKLVDDKVRELMPKEARQLGGNDSYAKEQRAREARHKLRRATVKAAMPKIVAAVEKNGGMVWRFIAETIVSGGGYHAALADVVKRRGLTIESGKRPEDVLQPLIAKFKEEQLRAFVVEAIAIMDATGGSYSEDYSKTFKEACRMFGADIKKLEAEHKEAAKAKAVAKKPPAAKKAAKK